LSTNSLTQTPDSNKITFDSESVTTY